MNDSTNPTRRVWVVTHPFSLGDHSMSFKKGDRVLDEVATATDAIEAQFRTFAVPAMEPDHDAIAAAAVEAQPAKPDKGKGAKVGAGSDTGDGSGSAAPPAAQ